MAKYNHHFNTQNMPKRVEPVRTRFYFPGSGILPLTLAEYVCVRLTGMLPKPRCVHDYPTAMSGAWKQVEFQVRSDDRSGTKAQEAEAAAPKPRPMPHHQSPLRGQRGETRGTFGPFYATPFDSTQEDV